MDLLMNVHDLETGMVLSRPVKRNGRLLYTEGRKIRPRDIARLKKWDISNIYVQPEQLTAVA